MKQSINKKILVELQIGFEFPILFKLESNKFNFVPKKQNLILILDEKLVNF